MSEIKLQAPVNSRLEALEWMDSDRPVLDRRTGRTVRPSTLPFKMSVELLAAKENARWVVYTLARISQPGSRFGKWRVLKRDRNGMIVGWRGDGRSPLPMMGERKIPAASELLEEIKNGDPEQP